ncbi:Endo-1,4-beta-xylanase Z precursor [Planctomycetes bacterium CA13]|uniref:Endo-1,4-beta-xylanase Z n=1 Tax=Novipirellula herctigrandis TaxID=2527986 RepID=A0A5C5Z972_9BACT|nr:Endo-1,4-beta-xylanase Z precursor [Planctomycetes bacterium CA13]
MTRDLLDTAIAIIFTASVTLVAQPLCAKTIHVSVDGDDAHAGSFQSPLRTIQHAADQAKPGDVITVHQGVYRERIDPPRGGTSDDTRIVFQAAEGEHVEIKGSEVIKGWKKVRNDTWEATIPNEFFGTFNPYSDVIHGDWFRPMKQTHHTGAVYQNSHWLVEAASIEDVLKPFGENNQKAEQYLLNLAWLRPKNGQKTSVDKASARHGVETAECSEGGSCVGWIDHGDWIQFNEFHFGNSTKQVELRVSAIVAGSIVELRQDSPEGELLGSCVVPRTGGWQEWTSVVAQIKPASGNRTLCVVFKQPQTDGLWFAEVDATNTRILAQFKEINPNESEVEINVRQAVFYPSKPGIDYLSLSGFSMMHAATPWAPPTAEQIGLVGTHWSKGWIIEDNEIRHSTCTGITLGKYGDEFDNTSENTAEGYVETINRALENGWAKDNVGHHIVRNNHISHCEQSGIVGSMGAIFSAVTDNTIHDIHVRRLFGGAEMAGIKFHAPIDCLISNNHIYNTCLGIWLDWMTQGTRVTRNFLHDNSRDLYVEVNHGPFLVDNNLLLSPVSVNVNSCGGAFVHNLFAGEITVKHNERRETPYHKAHSTEVVDLHGNPSGDDRYFNNIFVGHGLQAYDEATLPVFMTDNIFVHGAKASKHETDAMILSNGDPELELVHRTDGIHLRLKLDETWASKTCDIVTTETLGVAKAPNLPFVMPDGASYQIDTDFYGNKRKPNATTAGPFANRMSDLLITKAIQ